MSTTFWVVQGLGIVVVILTILSFFQKEKWKMMLFLSLTNLFMIAVYILSGSLLGGILVAGATVRTLVYFYFSQKNKRPDPIIMVLFEIYYVVVAISLWGKGLGAWELLMLVNLVVVTYTTWQKDVKVLRFGYLFSSLLLIPYDILLHAYVVAVSEILMLCSVIFTLVKYSKVTKSASNVAQRYFKANKHFWGSNVEEFNNFDLISSKGVDTTPFYNFGIVKNHQNLFETINEIKQKCKSEGLKEVAYLPFDANKFDQMASDANLLQIFFPVVFHDVWMKLIDGFNLNNTKCKIVGVQYMQVYEDKIDEIIKLYLMGYHARADLKNLTLAEKMWVENFKTLNLREIQDGIRIRAYIAYFEGNPISLVITLSNNVEAFITKVSTMPIFRRKHVASSLMQYAISDLRAKGIQEIVLVTDKYSTNEKFYAFNSFAEFGQAVALDVTNVKNYKNFINKHELN